MDSPHEGPSEQDGPRPRSDRLDHGHDRTGAAQGGLGDPRSGQPDPQGGLNDPQSGQAGAAHSGRNDPHSGLGAAGAATPQEPREREAPSPHGPFAALHFRNYRLFFMGQIVSLIGTWMQNVGQGWLVLELTNSPLVLGTVSALQFVPFLLFSLFAGVLIDRVPKRTLLIGTQSTLAVLAAVLAFLTLSGRVEVWHVMLLAAAIGTVNSIDNPTRQAFIVEMVGRDYVMNAVSLNSTTFNAARLVGPSVAGLLIAALGTGWAFVVNAASFVAVIAALAAMHFEAPARAARPARSRSEQAGERPMESRPTVWQDVGEGLDYLRRSPRVTALIALVGMISMFAINYNVLMPVLARTTLGGGAQTYGYLMSALGAGALCGALLMAVLSARGPQMNMLLGAGTIFTALVVVLGLVHQFIAAVPLLFIAGWAQISYTASSNSLVQVTVPNHLRGRVMSIYTMVLNGVTPLGSLLVGALSERFGSGAGFLVGGAVGLAAMVAAQLLRPRWDRLRR